MITTLKISFILITVGVILYILFVFIGLSNIDYHHIVLPSLSERKYPLKTALNINNTHNILNEFHNIYYNPYDLYM